MSHTPGPWKLVTEQGMHKIIGPHHPAVGSPPVAFYAVYGRGVGHQECIDECAANARLVAQAWTIPQLCAALEAVKPYLSKICCLEHEEAELTEIVDAALALANEPADHSKPD